MWVRELKYCELKYCELKKRRTYRMQYIGQVLQNRMTMLGITVPTLSERIFLEETVIQQLNRR